MADADEITLPVGLLLLPALVILALVGWLASPRDERGRPLLLLPDVRAMEAYRRQASAWLDEFRLLDGEIAVLLGEPPADLFGRSRRSQRAFERALRLSQEIDRQGAPPSLAGLREALHDLTQSYLEASRLALRWLSLPDSENLEQARRVLTDAQAHLKAVEGSRWLAKRSP
jgi:hypothetical protein